MTVSAIAVTEGSGKNIWTDQRTVSAVAREAQYVLPAEPAQATYSVVANSIDLDTTYTHVLEIMAGASLYVRVQQIEISWSIAGSVGTNISLYRLTTAGSGGTAVTPRPFDTGDAASGATAMTLPTSAGTEDVLLYQWRMLVPSATEPAQRFIWTPNPRTKPIIIAPGVTNGLAFKRTTQSTSGHADIIVTITETAWL